MSKRKQSNPTRNAFEASPAYKKRRMATISQAEFKKALSRTVEAKEVITNSRFPLYNASTFNNIVIPLTNIAQGLDEFQRIGRTVRHKAVTVNIAIASNGDATALPTAIIPANRWDVGFWAIVLDRQCNGLAPAFADCFDLISGSMTTSYSGIAPRQSTKNQERFQIVKRGEYNVGMDQNCQHDHVYLDLQKLLKGRDQTANYQDNTGTNASLGSGHLFLMVASANANLISTTATTVSYVAKWRFTDT